MSEKETRLLAEFPPVSTAEWEAVIQKDLKGADYAKRLHWQTDEGITVKAVLPQRRPERARVSGHRSGPVSLTRAARALRLTGRSAKRSKWTMPLTANAARKRAIAKGAEEIAYVGVKADTDLRNVAGRFGSDCRAFHRRRGCSRCARRADRAYEDEAAQRLHRLRSAGESGAGRGIRESRFRPASRPFALAGGTFPRSGRDLCAGTGLCSCRRRRSTGGTDRSRTRRRSAAPKFFFRFAVGSNYFFEIAKLRAARLLWAQGRQSLPTEERSVGESRDPLAHLALEQDDLRPYVNMLRATTEAMSAALGGCDSLAVGSFEKPTGSRTSSAGSWRATRRSS